jgi:hypothetical protein
MNWNTGLLAAGTVLLALALGGVQGLPVVIALIVSYWLVRSLGIAGAAHHEMRSQDRTARQREVEKETARERRSPRRGRPAEQECETERPRQRKSEEAAQQENEWWRVLGIAPHASLDEIRRAYRRRIKQCHPDRVAGLAPELRELAERCARTLNVAYNEANRVRRNETSML